MRTGHAPRSISASACLSQYVMSISRYIVVAMVRCSRACSRWPVRRASLPRPRWPGTGASSRGCYLSLARASSSGTRTQPRADVLVLDDAGGRGSGRHEASPGLGHGGEARPSPSWWTLADPVAGGHGSRGASVVVDPPPRYTYGVGRWRTQAAWLLPDAAAAACDWLGRDGHTFGHTESRSDCVLRRNHAEYRHAPVAQLDRASAF
jgi:hypothetical protein